MAKAKKRWIVSPPRAAKPAVPPLLKAEVEDKSQLLIDHFFKPTYVHPTPIDPQSNYLLDIWTKWYRGYFYFCSTYASPGPHALAPTFEARFARLEYVGNGQFHGAYMRHTGQWWEVFTNRTVDECMDTIRNELYFHP